MIYGGDKAIEMPVKDLYNTNMMIASINAAKDMYDKGIEEMKDFHKQYGDFYSPAGQDVEYWYNNTIKPIRDAIDYMYAHGINPTGSAESRAILARVANSAPAQDLARLKQTAETGRLYQKNAAVLKAAGKYSQPFEDFRMNGKNLSNWNTLRDGVWTEESPVEYKTLHDFVDPMLDNLTVRDLLPSEARSHYGDKYNANHKYEGIPYEDAAAAFKYQTAGLDGNDLLRYYKHLTEERMEASGALDGLTGTDRQKAIDDQFTKEAVYADAERWGKYKDLGLTPEAAAALQDRIKANEQQRSFNYSSALQRQKAADDRSLTLLTAYINGLVDKDGNPIPGVTGGGSSSGAGGTRAGIANNADGSPYGADWQLEQDSNDALMAGIDTDVSFGRYQNNLISAFKNRVNKIGRNNKWGGGHAWTDLRKAFLKDLDETVEHPLSRNHGRWPRYTNAVEQWKQKYPLLAERNEDYISGLEITLHHLGRLKNPGRGMKPEETLFGRMYTTDWLPAAQQRTQRSFQNKNTFTLTNANGVTKNSGQIVRDAMNVWNRSKDLDPTNYSGDVLAWAPTGQGQRTISRRMHYTPAIAILSGNANSDPRKVAHVVNIDNIIKNGQLSGASDATYGVGSINQNGSKFDSRLRKGGARFATQTVYLTGRKAKQLYNYLQEHNLNAEDYDIEYMGVDEPTVQTKPEEYIFAIPITNVVQEQSAIGGAAIATHKRVGGQTAAWGMGLQDQARGLGMRNAEDAMTSDYTSEYGIEE